MSIPPSIDCDALIAAHAELTRLWEGQRRVIAELQEQVEHLLGCVRASELEILRKDKGIANVYYGVQDYLAAAPLPVGRLEANREN